MDGHTVELVFPDGEEVRLAVAEGESIWDAAHREGITLPSMCLQGWCLTCAGRVLEGDFDPSDALRYYKQDKEQGFILLCTAKPRGLLRVLTHQKEAMQAHRLRRGLPTPRG